MRGLNRVKPNFKIEVLKMIVIDIVTRDMHELHGANRVTEKIIKGYEQFKVNGYLLRYTISRDGILDCSNYQVSTLGNHLNNKSYTKKRNLIEFAKKSPFYQTGLIQSLLVENEIKSNKLIIDNIMKSGTIADIIIFQDPFAAIYCIEHGLKINKSLFISHADRDPLEQLLLNRPSLKGTGEEKKLRKRIETLYNKVNKVVAICSASKEYIKNVYNLDAECILNGIEDIESPLKFVKLSKKDNKIHVAVVASLQYRKGQDILLDAFFRLCDSVKRHFKIHLIGTGDAEKPLKSSVKEANLSDCVEFHGAVLDVGSLLSQMDVFFLTSRADTVPISIIEALRAGLPIFASDIGEISYMIAGCGELLQPSIESVKEALEALADGRYDIETLGKRARKRYEEKFKLTAMIDSYIDVCNKIADKQ